jgi:hypothetical protein
MQVGVPRQIDESAGQGHPSGERFVVRCGSAHQEHAQCVVLDGEGHQVDADQRAVERQRGAVRGALLHGT